MPTEYPPKVLMPRKARMTRRRKTQLNNIALFVAVAVLGGFAIALGSAHAMGTHSVQDFTRKAAIGNEFEVETSQIALQKSQNDAVKRFAQHMVDDHSKAGDDLGSAMSQANLGEPDTSLDPKHQKMLDKLNAASSATFDRLYVKEQVKAHDEAVSLFKDYSKHGDNDTIKGFASDTLPTLEEHKQNIQQLKSSI